jgi:predicted Zn finger-like uncharacterized protein
MKIVCDNCATKYSIADEKVRGKVFKIRCKKCSHIIVVRGGEGAAAEPSRSGASADDGFPGDDASTMAAGGAAGLAAAAGATDAVWHLVIDREQVGPLTPEEVRAKHAAGEVDVETYAWREGFADWLRLGSIEDFRDLGGAPAQPEEGATRRTDAADLFAQSSGGDDGGGDAGSDLFGGGGASAPMPMAASPAAQPSGDAFGGGLFGAPEEAAPAKPSRPSRTSSPGFSANGGGGGMGAQTASVDEANSKMTGQRNENSVLFSLNNLQALASGGGGGGGGGAAPAPKPGVDNRPGFANSQTEGSGLIDIRAMAASTLATGGSSGPSSGPSARMDGPPGLDAAPIFSPMAAPILMPAAPSGPPKWMWPVLGVGALAVIGIIVVGVLLLTRKPEVPPVVAVAPTAPTAPNPTAPTAPNPTAPTAPTNPEVKGADSPTAPKEPKEDRPTRKDKGDKADKGLKAKPEKVREPEKTSGGVVLPPTDSPKAPVKKKGGDALDDLLNSASPDKPAPAEKKARPEPAADDSLPDQLDKGAIQGGMAKVKGKVGSCYEQFKVPGMANVQVTIGKNGHVSSANVSGSFSGTPTGSCVEKAVKGASFPPFKGAAMTFTYPFILR